ncbi:THUMP domain-containing protein 3 [Perkinsus olseni]|uniref:THUMP domain-containing protein 3 n=1 Tax=Perkinsus olseni TaxID=32597 RepID=A0A7J6KZE3_PEROL|nr:THUMP domain-containing protein 3 [Perkinsus olseni]
MRILLALMSPSAASSRCQYALLVLVSGGLEELAVHYIRQMDIKMEVEILWALTQGKACGGAASMGKILVKVSTLEDVRRFTRECRVAQTILALLTYNLDVADISPKKIEEIMYRQSEWSAAEEIVGIDAESVHTFRASCVRDGHHDFKSYDVMRTMGHAVLMRHPTWTVSLGYSEVEFVGIVFDRSVFIGIAVGKPQRGSLARPEKADFNVVPYCDYMSRDLQLGSVPHCTKMRPSVALLLLLFATDGLPMHGTMLDIMGGLGTIPIEAATNFTNVHALSGDINRATTSQAIKNCQLARPHLAEGSSVHARDWDAAQLDTLVDKDSVDWIVTDMPFGNRTELKKADMARVLRAVSVVLKPETGRCVLLSKGYKRLDTAAAGVDGLCLLERRMVIIGGFVCYLSKYSRPAEESTAAGDSDTV